MRFLAVDDDPNFLEVLKSFMRQEAEHELTLATSASEAVKIVQDMPEAHDAFFLDILMPEMNGVELCAALRSFEPLRDVPIFMLTAAADRHLINDAFAAGRRTTSTSRSMPTNYDPACPWRSGSTRRFALLPRRARSRARRAIPG